jgi:hypothetical protein
VKRSEVGCPLFFYGGQKKVSKKFLVSLPGTKIVCIFRSQSKIKVMKKSIADIQSVVSASPSSIFSKDDVLALLASIEVSAGKPELSEEFKAKLCTFVAENINDAMFNLASDDVVNFDSAEFELYGNEISLSSVQLDYRTFSSQVRNEVIEKMNDFFFEVEDEVKEVAEIN